MGSTHNDVVVLLADAEEALDVLLPLLFVDCWNFAKAGRVNSASEVLQVETIKT